MRDIYYNIESTSDGKLEITRRLYLYVGSPISNRLTYFVNKAEVFWLYARLKGFRPVYDYKKTALYVQTTRKLLLRNVVDIIENRLGFSLLGLPFRIELFDDNFFTVVFDSKL